MELDTRWACHGLVSSELCLLQCSALIYHTHSMYFRTDWKFFQDITTNTVDPSKCTTFSSRDIMSLSRDQSQSVLYIIQWVGVSKGVCSCKDTQPACSQLFSKKAFALLDRYSTNTSILQFNNETSVCSLLVTFTINSPWSMCSAVCVTLQWCWPPF